MRTAPVALAYLDDPDSLVLAAHELSAPTHQDPEAGEACALWCLAIRHAVLEGTLDVRSGLAYLPESRAGVWAAHLDEAEAGRPSDFEHNGWVAQALQGAWSAMTTNTTSAVPAAHNSGSSNAGSFDARSLDAGSSTASPAHFQRALEAAVRGGRDTDTVAAIAGSLVGGLYGASAVPAQWCRTLNGWPGLRARDLVRLGVLTAQWPPGLGGLADGRPDRLLDLPGPRRAGSPPP